MPIIEVGAFYSPMVETRTPSALLGKIQDRISIHSKIKIERRSFFSGKLIFNQW